MAHHFIQLILQQLKQTISPVPELPFLPAERGRVLTQVTQALTYTLVFHSCVSRARTLPVSARSPLGFLYGVCQLVTMGFCTQMKGSARNVCTFFNVQ